MTGAPGVVTVVVGNPKPGSRTLDAAIALADALIDIASNDTASNDTASNDTASNDTASNGSAPTKRGAHLRRGEAVDLATIADGLLAPWRLSPAASAAADSVRSSALLVLATPTYKASYTGLLKLFLDVFPAGSLAGTVVVPLVTSGGDAHRHLGDLQLRPVLSELGAVVPAPSLLLTEPEISRSADLAAGHAQRYGRLIRAAVAALAASTAAATGSPSS